MVNPTDNPPYKPMNGHEPLDNHVSQLPLFRSRRRAALTGFFGLALALGLAACSQSVSIARLLSDPSHWNNKTVQIHGTVQNAVGLLGEGMYSVSDGTGKIWVISNSGIPGKGVRVDVVGTVFQGAQFMGRSLGVALREQHHKTH